MSRQDSPTPATPATRFLRQHKIAFSAHHYDYVEHGGTAVAARALGVDEHCVVKTLIMEDERQQPLVVLMHGDHVVSTKELARQSGHKRIEVCKPEVANRHSGYLIGGTSPFGLRKTMPVYVETSIIDLDIIYLNGGRRGLLLGIDPAILQDLLKIRLVNAAN